MTRFPLNTVRPAVVFDTEVQLHGETVATSWTRDCGSECLERWSVLPFGHSSDTGNLKFKL